MGAETSKALRRLETLVLDGLRYGYFRCTVTVKMGNRKRRELVISAGRETKFHIPLEEIS